MKKMLLILALGLTFQVASAQVSSRNAAGYVKKTVDRGALVFLANPFNTFDGSDHTLTSMLGTDNLPNGTTVYAWNPASQQWQSSLFTAGIPALGIPDSWSPERNVQRAEGFFVQVQSTAPSASYDIYLFGEVPDRITAPTHQVAISPGLTSFGFGYPVSRLLSATDFQNEANNGDTIYSWNPTSGWGSAVFTAGIPALGIAASWSPDLALVPGCGYFYDSDAANNVNETKPYSWP